jgi:hypothetical protein
MNWRTRSILAMAIAGALHASAAYAQSQIGSAATTKNQVEGIDDSGTQPLPAGGSVFQNERVRTGEDSQAQLVFLDRTNLGVGPKSEVTLSRFVYNPDRKNGQVALEVGRGVFRFVTGSQDPKDYAIKTPIATIGVRGTEFHLLVDLDLIVVALVHGALQITTTRSRVVVLSQPGTAVTIHADGRVEGPRRWNGPITRYAGDVPFPYFPSSFAAVSPTPALSPAPGGSRAANNNPVVRGPLPGYRSGGIVYQTGLPRGRGGDRGGAPQGGDKGGTRGGVQGGVQGGKQSGRGGSQGTVYVPPRYGVIPRTSSGSGRSSLKLR